MTRREMLGAAASAALFSMQPASAQPRFLKNFGVAGTSFGARTRAGSAGGAGRGGRGGRGAEAAGGPPPAAPIMPPFDIIEYAHQNNLGTVEASPTGWDADSIKKFRARLESYNLRVIMGPQLPRDESALAAFEAQVKACKEAGAVCLRAAMTGRRYEDFDTDAQFRASFANNQKVVALAEPVLARNKVRLALENHKGWRADEHAAWLKRIGSEWVGVHLDFGNNVALCEDPMDTLKILRPYIISAHIKDMAVEPYDEGFLLSEVPLGDGFLNLNAIIQSLQEKDPNMIFDLEMMTRDPLKVPVFTDKYWATFQDVPAKDLAHTLDLVRKNKPKHPTFKTTGMSLPDQVKLEEENIQKCITWARQNFKA